MFTVTLTPAATIGLFIAHRVFQPKGVEQMRAALDTDKIFLKEGSGLVVTGEKGSITSVATENIEITIENHVHEHLKRAIASAIDEGKAFGFSPGQGSLLHGTEGFDAIEKAVKKEAPPKPTLVEKPLLAEEKKQKKA